MTEKKSIRETIAEMSKRIIENIHPQKIILFGSHARGTAGRDSDVDLLVVVPLEGSKRKKAVEIYTLLAGLGLPKDVIVVTPEEIEKYGNVPGTIVKSALDEGKVLYDRAA